MPQYNYAVFGRGPDKNPRKRRFVSALKTAGGIGAGAALSGVSLAGALPTAGLLYDHQNSLLQKRLALSGLALGSGYGLYKGIKRAVAEKQEKYKNSNSKHMTRFRPNSNFSDFDDEYSEEDEGYDSRDLFEATIENIRSGVASGILSDEEGEEAELNAIDEYNELVAQELGYEIEDDDEYDDEEFDEYEEYSDGSDMVYFQAGNSFGDGLVELFDAVGYDDLSEGVADLSEVLGLDEEDTAGLLTGDYVPHPELTRQIAEAFGVDDAVYAQLDSLGESARLDAGYEDEDVEDEDIIESAVENTAAYSRLENQLAEFQAEAILNKELDDFYLECHRGFNEGWLPPIAYRQMAGSFETEGDRLAAFSTLCDSHDVDAQTQLFGLQTALEIFRSCGPLMTFSSIVNEPLDPEEAEEDFVTSSQAELNFRLRKQRSQS